MCESQTDGHALRVFGFQAVASTAPRGIAGPVAEVLGREYVLSPFLRQAHDCDPAGPILLGPLDRKLGSVGTALGGEYGQGMAFREGICDLRGAEGIPGGKVGDHNVQGTLSASGAVTDRFVGGRFQRISPTLPVGYVVRGEVKQHIGRKS